MTKSEWLWIVIRVVGVFFVAKAIIAAPQVISSGISHLSYSDFIGEILDKSETMDNGNSHKIRNWTENLMIANFVEAVSEFIFYGVVGLYFCTRGRWLHRLITPPDDSPLAEKPE